VAETGTLKAPAPKGYAKLSPGLRSRVADVAFVVALVACVVALFGGSNLDGVWLRFPVNFALIALLPACWVLHRRKATTTAPVLRGGVLAGLIGLAVLAMALHKASGFVSLAGLLSFVSALAMRGSVNRALVRGRDIKVGERSPALLVFENIESLAAALILVLLVWHFGLEAFRIPSGSMAPTLLGDPVTGDRVLVDKFAYQWREPERWEPVVFRYPLRRSEPYVKRLVGLPGEQLLIAGGDIYIKRHDNAEIELLTKTPEAREVLWLPVIHGVRERRDWVTHFHREGDADFEGGWIRLRENGSAIFPRDGTSPGDIRDHDASFGATETHASQFNRHVVGDSRIRATARLRENGGLLVTLVRDADEYTLELQQGVGGAKLFHRETGETSQTRIAMEDLRGVEVHDQVRFSFWLADGEIGLELDGRHVARKHVGTPLLDQLRARDADSRLRLDSPEAIEIASAEPPAGRRGRIVMRPVDAGAEVRVAGIDRDIYYIGRQMDRRFVGLVELPLGVTLEGDQHYVLGDNSAGSADSRYWVRITLFLNDGTQVTGALDMPTQPELVGLLARTATSDGMNAYVHLQQLAHFTPQERGDDREHADTLVVRDSLELFREAARQHGRAGMDFFTEGGGYRRIVLADVENIQVEAHPHVERKLFVGRPWSVFLSPRGAKLID